MEKQKLPKPIPLTLSQYKCILCEKKFYINKEDETSEGSVCPFCSRTDVPNIREFDVEILAIGEVEQKPTELKNLN